MSEQKRFWAYMELNTVTCYSDSRRGFGLDHFNTQLVITLNYSAIANLHTLLITRTHANSFRPCTVFTSSFLVTASNNGYSPASVLKSSLNDGSLTTDSRPFHTNFLVFSSPPDYHLSIPATNLRSFHTNFLVFSSPPINWAPLQLNYSSQTPIQNWLGCPDCIPYNCSARTN
jgi:hypothetical protein